MTYYNFFKYVKMTASAVVLLLSTSCLSQEVVPTKAAAKKKPNILWIFIEDMNPLLSCYGDKVIKTPHFDRLAQNGVLFENAFATSGICSPCRSSVISGVMSTTFGFHNHSSAAPGYDEIRFPKGKDPLPVLFKKNGYHTFNAGKTHYNFLFNPNELYDSRRNNHFSRFTFPTKGPFFGQLQREGGKWQFFYDECYGINWKDRKFKLDPQKAAATLPPSYPKHPVYLREWAQHYDCVAVQDLDVGNILQDLKEQGLLENTIIFTFSDHGCYLPRSKAFVYGAGLHVPLIVSYFGNDPHIKKMIPANTRRTDVVSLLDITATSLALSDIPIPQWYESKNLFAPGYNREFAISTRDRCINAVDRVRSLRTKNFRYVRNFMTDRPYLESDYRTNREFTIVMKKLYKEGELTPEQAWFWSAERPSEELYDLRNDPHELKNLAGNAAYQQELLRHRKLLEQWVKETGDKGQYPESEKGLLSAYLKGMLKKSDRQPGSPEFDVIKEKYKKEILAVEQRIKRRKKKK